RLAQRDLSDVTRQEDEAQEPESEHDGECRVELKPDVETGWDPGQNRKRDEREADSHDHPAHSVATTRSPRGFRMISTARITTRATRRGKPIDWIQIVG